MNVAVTGAGGFLGRYFLRALLDGDDFEITAFTSHPKELLRNNSFESSHLTVLPSNAYDKIAWSNVEILFNLAYPRNTDGIDIAKGFEYVSKVFLSAQQGGVRGVVNISSQSVYSKMRSEPASEDTELNLESIYAAGKYAAELLVNNMFYNIPHTNIRLASLIGPGFDQRITNVFVRQALDGKDLQVLKDNQRFGFLDVRDAADGLAALAKGGKEEWREAYNLGPCTAYTLEEIAKAVCELSQDYCGRKASYKLLPGEKVLNTSLDSSLFMNTFHWKPKHNLKSSLSAVFEEMKRER